MFKKLFNNILGGGDENETNPAQSTQQNSSSTTKADSGLYNEYNKLRKQYETDPSCVEELYEICKQISIEESADLYQRSLNIQEKYNSLLPRLYELFEEKEDDDDAEEAYEELLEKVQDLEAQMRPNYETYLKKKYEIRDKLFPEMAERSKALFKQDMDNFNQDFDTYTPPTDGDDDEEEIDVEAYMAQQQMGGAPMVQSMAGGMGLPADSPLLQPIHGITIEDFAAAGGKMLKGMSEQEVLKLLNVDKPMWDEAGVLWQQRFQQDQTFTLMTVYNQAYAACDTHPKFANAQPAVSKSTNPENLKKVQKDPLFYYELAGARQAAIDFGHDGAQWIMENYGIALEDFQAAAMQHMQDMSKIDTYMKYQEKKQIEYEKIFEKELGPGIADDIEF